MRITTNAILRNYKSNLGTSLSNLDIARTRVMTQRKFNSTAEDPSSALRAAVLQRKYARNEDYRSLVQDVQSFQDSQEDAAMQINNLAKTLSKQYGLEALNGTNGSRETRETYAAAWRGAQESMVLSLNASYEGKYVFAGSDGLEAPFKLTKDANGKQILLYRNVDVTTGDLYKSDGTLDAAVDQADKDAAVATPPVDKKAQRLKELSEDTLFVDLGFGLSMDLDFNDISDKTKTGNIDKSSVFNTSLPGINVVGFGVNEETGNPNNMIILMGQIADKLSAADFDYEGYRELLGEFDEGRDKVLEQVTTLGTQTEFLTTTKDRLDTAMINLTTQIDNVVNIDMAEAIMNFSWAQYAYNAALKVGNNILTPSFIDFMR